MILPATWNGVGGFQGRELLGQSFKPGVTGQLTKVSLSLSRDYTLFGVYGYVRVFVKSELGGEEDAILAESEGFALSDLSDSPASPTWIDFSFPAPVTVTSGQTYYMELHSSGYYLNGPVAVLPEIYWSEDPDPYSGGQGFLREDCIWDNASPTNLSFSFKTYIDGQLDQELSSQFGTYMQGTELQWTRMQTYNRTTGQWETRSAKQAESGYDDITLKGSKNEDLDEYYDVDGWLSVRVSNDSLNSPVLATDLLNIDFLRAISVTTNPDGTYTISGLPSGNFTATFVKTGYIEETLDVTADPGQTLTLDVQLIPEESRITGTVTDSETGLPVSSVSVTVTDSLNNIHTTTTSSPGVYTVSGLVHGDFTATFTRSGYIEQTINSTVSPGQILTLDVQLIPIPPLTVTITSPLDGAVLNSTPITVSGNVTNNADVTVNSIQANVNGNSFSASIPLNEGFNIITATATDQYSQFAYNTINVTLITKGSITGTVTDSSTGLPLPSASVTVTDSLSNQQTTLTATDGTYTINDIASGDFSGNITKDGYTTYNFSGTMSPEQTIIIDAVLDPVLPVISNISVINITYDSVTITWTTDQPSDSLVDYGLTSSYGGSEYDAALTASHSITLTNLTMGTEYHFMVTSANIYGFSSSSGDNTFTTLSPITLTITSPSDSDTINRPDTMVKGTVTNSLGNETGVTVNGIVAVVYNGEFFVNHVPLEEGENTITVNAVDTADNTATTSITVDSVVSTPYVTLNANIESGIAPLETALRIDGTFYIEASVMNVAGPGQIEWLETGVEEYRVRITTEGVYYFTAEATDSQSNTYTDTIVIVVLNVNDLDALLQAKWEGMKTALIAGDIETGINYFVEESKDRYITIFTQFNSTQINSIFLDVIEFKIYSLNESFAKCGALRAESGGTFSYPVTFVKDENGIWKIMGF